MLGKYRNSSFLKFALNSHWLPRCPLWCSFSVASHLYHSLETTDICKCGQVSWNMILHSIFCYQHISLFMLNGLSDWSNITKSHELSVHECHISFKLHETILTVCSVTFLRQAIAMVTPEMRADELNVYCKYLCFLSHRSSKIAISSLVWTSYYRKVCEVQLSSCCCFPKHLYGYRNNSDTSIELLQECKKIVVQLMIFLWVFAPCT